MVSQTMPSSKLWFRGTLEINVVMTELNWLPLEDFRVQW